MYVFSALFCQLYKHQAHNIGPAHSVHESGSGMERHSYETKKHEKRHIPLIVGDATFMVWRILPWPVMCVVVLKLLPFRIGIYELSFEISFIV